jgi:hypothetical protein
VDGRQRQQLVYRGSGGNIDLNAEGDGLCFGQFEAKGRAAVSGNSFKCSYKSNHSTGTCEGTITSDGNLIESKVSDSACGVFPTTLYRQ